jgi:hypothetical protein
MRAASSLKMESDESRDELFLFERVRQHQIWQSQALWEDSFFDELLSKHRAAQAARPPLPPKPAAQSAKATSSVQQAKVKTDTLRRAHSKGLCAACGCCQWRGLKCFLAITQLKTLPMMKSMMMKLTKWFLMLI